MNTFVTLSLDNKVVFKVEFEVLWRKTEAGALPIVSQPNGAPAFVLASTPPPTSAFATSAGGGGGGGGTTNGGGNKASSSSSGAIVAIVVVVLICVIASVLVAVFLYRRLQKQKEMLEQQAPSEQQQQQGYNSQGAGTALSYTSGGHQYQTPPRPSMSIQSNGSATNNIYGNVSCKTA